MRSIRSNKELIIYVFVVFLIINFVSSGGHTDQWDGVVTFFITESMVLKHTAKMDPEIPSISNTSVPVMTDGYVLYETQNNKVVTGKFYEWVSMGRPIEPVYISRALLLPTISVPFYFLSVVLAVNPISLVALTVNSIIISLTALVIFCFSLDLYKSRQLAFILGIIFTGCTFILPYNTSLFPQPIQALCLVSGVFFLYKARHTNALFICTFTQKIHTNRGTTYLYCGLSGLFFGLTIFASPTSSIFFPGYLICSFIFLRHNKKAFLCFLLTVAILLIFAGILNYVRFGSITEFGYGAQYANILSMNTGWKGLLGLLVSPGKGLLFYFPPIILLPLAILFSRFQNKTLWFITLYVLGAAWLYFGTINIEGGSRYWSGAFAWGPRYLIATLPLIVIMLGYLVKYPKKLVKYRKNANVRLLINASLIATCFAGFIFNLGGVLVWHEYGLMYSFEREKLYSDVDGLTTWVPKYSPIILHMKMLYEDYVTNIPVQSYKNTGWGYATYGLAPCQFDLYILCKFGIVPLIVLSSAAILLTVIILANRKHIQVYF